MAAGVASSPFSGAIAAATQRSSKTVRTATEQTEQLFRQLTATVEQLTIENAALQARIVTLESIYERDVRASQAKQDAQKSAMVELQKQVQQLSSSLAASRAQSASDRAALLAQQQALACKWQPLGRR